ncbi:hypothetical protein SERLA73DRAFT_177791, partial [Serpula lacrymans var. lacrymans S7.3]
MHSCVGVCVSRFIAADRCRVRNTGYPSHYLFASLSFRVLENERCTFSLTDPDHDGKSQQSQQGNLSFYFLRINLLLSCLVLAGGRWLLTIFYPRALMLFNGCYPVLEVRRLQASCLLFSPTSIFQLSKSSPLPRLQLNIPPDLPQ